MVPPDHPVQHDDQQKIECGREQSGGEVPRIRGFEAEQPEEARLDVHVHGRVLERLGYVVAGSEHACGLADVHEGIHVDDGREAVIDVVQTQRRRQQQHRAEKNDIVPRPAVSRGRSPIASGCEVPHAAVAPE